MCHCLHTCKQMFFYADACLQALDLRAAVCLQAAICVCKQCLHHAIIESRSMPASADPLFSAHSRDYKSNLYVYPVLSRRAGGISIGVNLNRNKFCNFHCIYCQVDLAEPGEDDLVDLERLQQELEWTVELVISGRIFAGEQFCGTPAPLRRLNDIAFSGDGEPTAYRNFAAGGGGVRGSPPPPPAGRRETGAYNQRQPAASLERAARAGNFGPEQRRDLGETGRRQRRLLPPGRPLGRATDANFGEHSRRGPGKAHRDPDAFSCGSRT